MKKEPGSNQALRAVFIDRDGVLVRSDVIDGKPVAVRELARFRLLPGVVGAHARLKSAGFRTVIVTNQPDIAKARISWAIMQQMNARLTQRLAVDQIEICPHAQDEGCACRKPKSAMLIRAAEKLRVDLNQSFMIGDRLSDMQAAAGAGCHAIFVDRHYCEPLPPSDSLLASVPHFPAAVALILRQGIHP